MRIKGLINGVLLALFALANASCIHSEKSTEKDGAAIQKASTESKTDEGTKKAEELDSRNPANVSDHAGYKTYIGQLVASTGERFATEYLEHEKHRFYEKLPTNPTATIKELAGREIWFKSAPNDRFHAYTFNQKINSPINWWKVLRASDRNQRFYIWGSLPDPECCDPRNPEECKRNGIALPANVETYGFDYCRGDEELLKHVGKFRIDENGQKVSTYRDPACDNPIIKAADALDKTKEREDRCSLAFGTSTGSVGFRKFPNPRFNAKRWKEIGGWDAFDDRIPDCDPTKTSQGKCSVKRFDDGSVEPPFRVGLTCACCHASYDPLNPPPMLGGADIQKQKIDFSKVTWAHIKGELGNQYLRSSEMLSSGTSPRSLEFQLFSHANAGAVDTSAIPYDFTMNPGTINALINVPRRPQFKDVVKRWHRGEGCGGGTDTQVVTYKNTDGKEFTQKWEYCEKEMDVFHILKGGEDSVGADLAVQRVYLNIGMCAEQCWMNHLVNLKAINPGERGRVQTPFDIKQCRADCSAFRANEDRVFEVYEYLASRRPTDLKVALTKGREVDGKKDKPAIEEKEAIETGDSRLPNPQLDSKFQEWVEARYGKGSIEEGKKLFAQQCASCHSSQDYAKVKERRDFNSRPVEPNDFHGMTKIDNNELIRMDWMGNEQSTPVQRVGTYACRSMHSNHAQGNVWQEFGSETNKQRNSKSKVQYSVRGKDPSNGRGYYRNISLLSLWAHAPFMHNNGMGPELCGRPDDKSRELHRSSKASRRGQTVCDYKFNPSVEARVKIFEDSVDELLSQESDRDQKVSILDKRISIPLGIKSVRPGKGNTILTLDLPGYEDMKSAGSSVKPTEVHYLGNFNFKQFAEHYGYCYSTALDKKAEYKPEKQAKFVECFEKFFNDDKASGKKVGLAALETLERFSKNVISSLTNAQLAMQEISEGDNKRLYIYLQNYSSCPHGVTENQGHTFGTKELSAEQKKQLKAFLITL